MTSMRPSILAATARHGPLFKCRANDGRPNLICSPCVKHSYRQMTSSANTKMDSSVTSSVEATDSWQSNIQSTNRQEVKCLRTASSFVRNISAEQRKDIGIAQEVTGKNACMNCPTILTKEGFARLISRLEHPNRDFKLTSTVMCQVSRRLLQEKLNDLCGEANSAGLMHDIDDSTMYKDRWGKLTESEKSDFARHHISRAVRYMEKMTAYNNAVKMNVEGVDNEIASSIERQLRRCTDLKTQHNQRQNGTCTNRAFHALNSQRNLCAIIETVTNLAYLDINWRTALRLYTYSRELTGVHPSVELTTRVMGLMTAYRTNHIGSRPWQEALYLYSELQESGYDSTLMTHTHALDALWRAAQKMNRHQQKVVNTEETILYYNSAIYSAASCQEDTSSKNYCIQSSNVDVYKTIMNIHNQVESSSRLRIAGEEGCMYMEALIKALCATGHWQQALKIFQDMDEHSGKLTHRLLVPTAETYIFLMAACNQQGLAAQSTALRNLFELHYSLQDVHSECLNIYLHSLKHVLGLDSTVGEQLETLLGQNSVLTRPSIVICMQLISSSQILLQQTKTSLSYRLLAMYESNAWQQKQPARLHEIRVLNQSLFRIQQQEQETGNSEKILQTFHRLIACTYGQHSLENKLCQQTEIYKLSEEVKWQEATAIYTRHKKSLLCEGVLIIPLRQLQTMTAQALLRCVTNQYNTRAVNTFLIEEDLTDTSQLIEDTLAQITDTVHNIYKGADAPNLLIAQLYLYHAQQTHNKKCKTALATQAVEEVALCPASLISQSIIESISLVTGFTVMHLERTLIVNHAKMRAKKLCKDDYRWWQPCHAIQRVYY